MSKVSYNILSLTEFFYNNAFSTTTSIFLFFANKNYYYSILVYFKCNISPKLTTLLLILMNYKVYLKLKSLQSNSITKSLLMYGIFLYLISK